jgi:hypothetical protein
MDGIARWLLCEKNMKKSLILFLLPIVMILAGSQAKAQYQHALGVRFSYYPGITFKTHVSEPGAVEMILDTRWGGWIFTGLYEHHFPFPPDYFRFYVGGGGHVGLWPYNPRWDPYWGPWDGGPFVGLDGIIGVEYTIPNFPLNFSLDYKPSINLFGWYGWWYDNVALSARFVF